MSPESALIHLTFQFQTVVYLRKKNGGFIDDVALFRILVIQCIMLVKCICYSSSLKFAMVIWDVVGCTSDDCHCAGPGATFVDKSSANILN